MPFKGSVPSNFPEKETFQTKAADIVLFGTLNANIPSINASNWMEDITKELQHQGISSIYNPNVGTQGERNLAQESYQITHGKIILMNFEGKFGGTSLAEVRFALLSAALNGQKVLVNFEKPLDSRARKARTLAKVDIALMKEQFGDSLDVQIFGEDPKTSLGIRDLAHHAKIALESPNTTLSAPYAMRKPATGYKYDFSFSGPNREVDEASREAILDELTPLGSVIDTNIQGFGKNIRRNRRREMNMMLDARTQVVLVTESSASKMAHAIASVAIAYLNGGQVLAYIPKELMGKNDIKTILSHFDMLTQEYPHLSSIFKMTNNIKDISTLTK